MGFETERKIGAEVTSAMEVVVGPKSGVIETISSASLRDWGSTEEVDDQE